MTAGLQLLIVTSLPLVPTVCPLLEDYLVKLVSLSHVLYMYYCLRNV